MDCRVKPGNDGACGTASRCFLLSRNKMAGLSARPFSFSNLRIAYAAAAFGCTSAV
jgi:hypothetical protein